MRFDPVVELGPRKAFIEADTERDIVVDRHRKGRRLLKNHADFRAQEVQIQSRGQDVFAVDENLAGCSLPG